MDLKLAKTCETCEYLKSESWSKMLSTIYHKYICTYNKPEEIIGDTHKDTSFLEHRIVCDFWKKHNNL